MKKLLILLILIFLLSGCGIYNLNIFVLPDDTEFLTLVQELDTPRKICQYMLENFTYELHGLYAPCPYTLWQTQKGDCNDFSTFATFIANYHGYKTYQIKIFYKNSTMNHYLAIYRENGLYNFSDNQYYFPVNCDNFSDIVLLDSQWMYYSYGFILSSYTIYDYWNNVVEQVIR